MCRSSCIVCKQRASLLHGYAGVVWGYQLLWKYCHIVCNPNSFFLNGLTCASWGHQLVCRSSYILCKQRASLQQVLLEIGSTDAWVATLVATVVLLPIMLKHVRFEVFGHLEGEMALITVLGLFHVLSLRVCCLIDQAIQVTEYCRNQLKIEAVLKSESNWIAFA